MDQYSQEQHMIAQQVKANGQAVAQLTLRQFSHEAKMEDGNDTDLVLFEEETSFKNVIADPKTAHKLEPSRLKKPHHSSGDKTSLPRHTQDAISCICWYGSQDLERQLQELF